MTIRPCEFTMSKKYLEIRCPSCANLSEERDAVFQTFARRKLLNFKNTSRWDKQKFKDNLSRFEKTFLELE